MISIRTTYQTVLQTPEGIARLFPPNSRIVQAISLASLGILILRLDLLASLFLLTGLILIIRLALFLTPRSPRTALALKAVFLDRPMRDRVKQRDLVRSPKPEIMMTESEKHNVSDRPDQKARRVHPLVRVDAVLAMNLDGNDESLEAVMEREEIIPIEEVEAELEKLNVDPSDAIRTVKNAVRKARQNPESVGSASDVLLRDGI